MPVESDPNLTCPPSFSLFACPIHHLSHQGSPKPSFGWYPHLPISRHGIQQTADLTGGCSSAQMTACHRFRGRITRYTFPSPSHSPARPSSAGPTLSSHSFPILAHHSHTSLVAHNFIHYQNGGRRLALNLVSSSARPLSRHRQLRPVWNLAGFYPTSQLRA